MLEIEDLVRFNKPIPRYTSYPTAPKWGAISSTTYESHLNKIGKRPLSLYLHIPFCESMCLYCGCAVILNRRPENEAIYVSYLLKEIALVASRLHERPPVKEIHFGGGTPTKLTSSQLEEIMQALRLSFDIEPNADISIEIDPRTVYQDEGEKLKLLKKMGFNRVSFGVQDSNEKVQEAIRRRQSFEMTKKCYQLARELEFTGINIDLIYGLPFQTLVTFEKTIEDILSLKPDRIALFSYAKVPWLKPHQKAIKEETLPTVNEKFEIYLRARLRLINAGYTALGMDHFGLVEDKLTKAYKEGTLHRNFQGYTLQGASEMIPFGVTAIGELFSDYFQNIKELEPYYASLDQGILPIAKGLLLTQEDILRKYVIKKIMCSFQVDKAAFQEQFNEKFDVHFKKELESLQELIIDGYVTNYPGRLVVEEKGRLFVRNIASHFDAYLQQEELKSRFSSAI